MNRGYAVCLRNKGMKTLHIFSLNTCFLHVTFTARLFESVALEPIIWESDQANLQPRNSCWAIGSSWGSSYQECSVWSCQINVKVGRDLGQLLYWMSHNLGSRAFLEIAMRRVSSKLLFFWFNTPIAAWALALGRQIHGPSRTHKSNSVTQSTHLL